MIDIWNHHATPAVSCYLYANASLGTAVCTPAEVCVGLWDRDIRSLGACFLGFGCEVGRREVREIIGIG